MFYTVEMNFPYPERQSEFDTWYAAHLQKIITVPGFLSAQRFGATRPTASTASTRWRCTPTSRTR